MDANKNLGKRYFWTEANYSESQNDFIIYDNGTWQNFSNYTIDNNITKKVPAKSFFINLVI